MAVIIIIICHHSSSILWAARGSAVLQSLALTCIDPVLKPKAISEVFGFLLLWSKELWAVVMGCFKPAVHGLRNLAELVLSVRSETPFLSRNFTWRAPKACKSLTVTPSAHQPWTRSTPQDMKRKGWADLKPDPPSPLTQQGSGDTATPQLWGQTHSARAWGAKNTSVSPWGLKENDHKTM